jgi:demethylmenaquinone methyltransferase/2-methoxy-6-polyprenyl-1,4-benzoquinol methylase
MAKAEQVRHMFSRISRRYDLANRLLSMGIDIYWRKRLVALVRKTRPATIIDLATGSGDVALALARGIPELTALEAYDFCEPMLEQARLKQQALDPSDQGKRIQFAIGDCLNLPIQDQTADAVTIAFGLRNLEDRHRGLCEIKRILKPNGSLFCLEFSTPYWWVKPFYTFYLKLILPLFATILTGDRKAYTYLGTSIEQFPEATSLAAEFIMAGFSRVETTALSGGIVYIHRGIAP